ncbi:MAG: amidohydrolase family protein, partial [Proteobacteria bacterium]|nr:amidohydrolase family protein [Pseudomonadota bacterium]
MRLVPPLLSLLVALFGCKPASDTKTPDDTDTDDTDVPDNPDWTLGPALPDCTPAAGSGIDVALSGVVLTIDGPEAGWVVYNKSTGIIECVGAACDPGDAEVVCTEGVISPGLIDTHNHLQYNILGPWDHDELYGDRYDWQSDGDYWDFREAYNDLWDSGFYECEIGIWVELRVLVGGGTSAVGASGPDCIDVLVRNLDEESGITDYKLYYSSGKVQWVDESDGDDFANELNSGKYEAVLHHVAEGIDGRVSWEIDHMFDIGMTGPGQLYVHATDATVSQLAQMAADGTGIIWSPRSNLDLYAQTTPADVALRLGVPLIVGPDWTWSGSANPPEEMACAYDYLQSRQSDISDVELFSLETDEAARLLNLDGLVGSLYEGMIADISVFSWSDEPYRAVIQAEPTDVRLVIIGGQAHYGLSELAQNISPNAAYCETVDACGEDRVLCFDSDDWYSADIAATLQTALSSITMPAELAYAKELYGLWTCDEDRPSCDISMTATTEDADGDGVADGDDLCVGAYDPLQKDHDGDGVGDACDPCPLYANGEDCDHEPSDIDGDGVANTTDLCPWIYDDQGDADGDNKGDACDDCPNDSNPGDAPCPAVPLLISDIRDPSSPDHPATLSPVSVANVVVTALREGKGFFIQDP